MVTHPEPAEGEPPLDPEVLAKPYYSDFSILLLAVIAEHVFIFAKALIVALLKETPTRILEAEHEKSSSIARANERIKEVKDHKKAVDFEDTQREK